MKKIQFHLITLGLLLVLSSATHKTTDSPSTSPDVFNYNDYIEVFKDDFDQQQLNTNYWRVADNFFKTIEQRNYIYTKDNVKVQDGNLVISAQRQKVTFNDKSYDYTGGFIDSNSTQAITLKFNQYTEARIKITQYKESDLSEPGFFGIPMNYESWPHPTEFQIMKCSIFDDNTQQNYPYVYNTFIYYQWVDNGDCRIQYRSPYKKLDFSEYHTYGMLLKENEVTFYIDGEAQFSYVANDPSNSSLLGCRIRIPKKDILLGFDYVVKNTLLTPKQMYVDYVRILKPKK
ncbi:glycosyl hydrolase family 16 laminarinase (macronuclear) [Tetrahymena thermophila SB210]|uniref:Glycosyl hydrolase family 16 laminarinase n=1 Tax=Tetrahymena thermophila (strain SB210) TaxID=312017 RepID=Q23VF5_TETTS|nr:glycosyl hydrolase family 16 laminarinase [Tetrahymena thermophila SB210]EAS00481.2 glycosyl hydrolase family 16 laminarinase [Tetrahymena thermophila SB210]|eukprot:XP_001020726.2 glycosyl hydrolase family 16 laminarinase [Tetrahymena thermophila SB210]